MKAFYDSSDGLAQSIVISVPKGSYVPVFSAPIEKLETESTDQHPDQGVSTSFSRTVAVEKFDVFPVRQLQKLLTYAQN